ncbi:MULTISPECIES: hypothetical protein [Proteiniphilum]|uniref:hypothetical protein n=1 Tax=Proteiniphilum TaxID=294702 RepID=UPI0003A6BC82|nr:MULTISPECIES: hypothetical protein [Proteiniphilum]SFL56468.1 hypothetical protein SAMN05216357_12916 [Porphyromonadaceae bacterium KH3CP3RA]
MSAKDYQHDLSDNPDIYSDYWLHSGKHSFANIRTEPTFCLVYSGELIIECGDETISIGKGDCLFLKGEQIVNMEQKNCGPDKFCGIFIEFNQSFLLDFYNNRRRKRYSVNNKCISGNMVKLQNIPCIRSLYVSMIPFLEAGEKLPKYLLELKQLEAVYSLLVLDKNFYPCLFDVCDTSLMNLLHENNICKN